MFGRYGALEILLVAILATSLSLVHGNSSPSSGQFEAKACPDFTSISYKYLKGLYLNTKYAFVVLQNISKNCCRNLSYTSVELPINNSHLIDDLIRRDEEAGNVSLYFPIYAPRKASKVFDDFPFIPWWKSPGPAVIAPTLSTNRSKQIIDAILKAWPLIILQLALGGLAGLLYWITERRINSDQFPRSFFSGAWEGYWCAMVTMTTVGYGDRAPVTILGRLFTIIWMLLSLVLTNAFTAHLSSSLTADDISVSVDHFMGSRIGVSLGTKYYYTEEYNLGARFVEFKNLTEFMQALQDRDLDKGMIEDYLAARYILKMYDVEFEGFKIEKVFAKSLDIGLTVAGYRWDDQSSINSGSNNDRFFKCLKKMVQIRMYEEDAFVDYPREYQKKTTEANSFNTPEGRKYIMYIGAALGILCTVGAIWQLAWPRLTKTEIVKAPSTETIELQKERYNLPTLYNGTDSKKWRISMDKNLYTTIDDVHKNGKVWDM